ncbi:MAG TPA: hypothetical protein PLU35_09460 [Phycisphaerales bacterium]|nr:hypothetical protein [Phycisphaerales bacterium]
MSDASGHIDDPTIPPSCALLRRIYPEWVVSDDNAGGQRISSAGFKDTEISVHIGDDLAAMGLSPEVVVERYPDYDLAAIHAATAREMGQRVYREHKPDQLCHGIVAGKKSKATAERMAAEATANWVVRRSRQE